MGYIPPSAKWYIAQLVTSFTFEDAEGVKMEISYKLIRADSPEEAYANALRQGKQEEIVYTNTDQKTVTVKFHGLCELNVIHDELENGAELMFEWHDFDSPKAIDRFLSTKEELGVFRPIEPQ